MFDELSDDKEYREHKIIARAPFKYLGNKRQEVPFLMQHIPYGESFVEVFGGSMALLLARQSSPLEVYNDRYSGVVAFYKCLQRPELFEKLKKLLTMCLHSREEFNDVLRNDYQDDVMRAYQFYYLQHYSFASKGTAFARATTTGNPFGHISTTFEILEEVHRRIKKVIIENLDWRDCLKDFDTKHAVFYLDPPYLNCSRNTYKFTLTEKEHEEMCDAIMGMKAFVALSGYDNPLYNKYHWDKIIYLPTKSGTSVKPGLQFEENQEGEKEVLWIKSSF